MRKLTLVAAIAAAFLTVSGAGPHGHLQAAGFKDSELAQRAQDAYLVKRNYTSRDHRILHRLNSKKSGV